MNRIEFGDCRDTMRRWAAEGVKVQTCVTSPPYFGLRDYGHDGQIGLEQTPEEYIAAMIEVFRCVRDVLADDGTLWVNIGDSYASGGRKTRDSDEKLAQRGMDTRPADPAGIKPKDLIGIPWMLAFALRADGWYLRQDIIWHKPNPMPESVTDRCTKAHEYLFLLTKSERYFYDAESILEPASPGTHARLSQDVQNQIGSARGYAGADADRPMKAVGRGHNTRPRKSVPNGAGTGFKVKNNDSFNEAMAIMPTHRNKRSVWTVPTKPYSGAHFATFPPALIEPCILAGSRPGDVVLDPFMGSGTTAQVAQALGRQWIGCEINEQYAPLQRERTAQHGLFL